MLFALILTPCNASFRCKCKKRNSSAELPNLCSLYFIACTCICISLLLEQWEHTTTLTWLFHSLLVMHTLYPRAVTSSLLLRKTGRKRNHGLPCLPFIWGKDSSIHGELVQESSGIRRNTTGLLVARVSLNTVASFCIGSKFWLNVLKGHLPLEA